MDEDAGASWAADDWNSEGKRLVGEKDYPVSREAFEKAAYLRRENLAARRRKEEAQYKHDPSVSRTKKGCVSLLLSLVLAFGGLSSCVVGMFAGFPDGGGDLRLILVGVGLLVGALALPLVVFFKSVEYRDSASGR